MSPKTFGFNYFFLFFGHKLKFMKALLSILLFSLFTGMLLLGSCGKSDLDKRCGSNWSPATELEQEINDLNNAVITYGQNPTPANCEAYKQAYLDYLDALKEWEDCYVYSGLQDDFKQSIADAEAAVNALECQ